MNIKQTVKKFIIIIAIGAGMLTLTTPLSVSAECQGEQLNVTTSCNNGCGVDTAIISCKNVDITKGGTTNNGVWSLLLTVINILTAGVGIAAVGGIVYGAILYTSAGGNAEQTKKAIEFIRNVVIGLVAYGLMFSLLNYIIPGGLFG